jgi:PAS domain S-box-containing protein
MKNALMDVVRGLRGRLVVVVLLAMLPAVALNLHQDGEARRRATADARESALRLARVVAGGHERLLEDTRQMLSVLARLPDVVEQRSERCSTLLARLVKGFYPEHANVFAAFTTRGDRFCSATFARGGLNVADRRYFQDVLRTRQFTVGEYVVTRTNGVPVLTAAHPVFDEQDTLVGIVFAGISVDLVARLASNAAMPPGTVVAITDADGTLVARHPDPERWVGTSVSDRPMFRAMRRRPGEYTEDLPSLDGVDRILAFKALSDGRGSARGFVVVGIPRAVALAAADRNLGRSLGGLAVATLLAAGLAWITADALVLRPTRALVRASRRLAAGDLSSRSGLSDARGETGELAAAFDTMAAALEARVAQADHAAELLRHSEARYRLLAENVNDVLWILGTDGRFWYVSPSVAGLTGFTAEETMARGLAETLTPASLEVASRALREGLAAARTEPPDVPREATLDLEHVCKDGSTVWGEIRASPLRDAAGRVIGVLGVTRDITDRKRAERQISLQVAALEAAANGIVITDAAGAIQWVNPAFTRMTGYAAVEAIGRTPRILRSGEQDDRFYAALWTTILAGRVWRGELTNRRKDGTVYTEEMTITPVRDEAGAIGHFVAIKQDVTQRREAAAELARQREVVHQSEKLASMGRLLAGVAHELKNPLSVVLARAELLRRALAGTSHESSIQKVEAAADRCARIVKNFVALARQRPTERQAVNLNEVIQDVVELLAYPLRTDGVEVELRLEPDLGPVWGDPDQLHQMLVNLVTNAHQAMRTVGPPRRLTLATGLDAARSQLRLWVSDTGPGIPPDIQPRIFEPFYTTKPVGQGTGLGLSLCQAIVEAHGGTLEVRSEPRDTTFTVWLPATSPLAGGEAVPATATPVVRDKRILVVDDEPEVATVLSEYLAEDGHHVDVAGDGLQALQKIAHGAYDVILSDLRMPNLDGPGLYRALEARDPALLRRLLFMTGDTLSEEIAQFLQVARVPTLGKPFDYAEVRRLVRDACDAGR